MRRAEAGNVRATGVILMSFGAAASPEAIPAYLSSVRGGHPVPQELVTEFQRRYRLIGGSPLTRITREQAAALESLLNGGTGGGSSGPATVSPAGTRPAAPRATDPVARGAAEAGLPTAGPRYRVLVGMRHAPPLIEDAFRELAALGVTRVIAIIMAPQHSPIIMAGYHRAVKQAQVALGPDASVVVPGAWHTVPAFLDALAQRVREALERMPAPERATVPVLFTAHSLPRSVVDREPEYIDMLKHTADETIRRARLDPARCRFAYQSAGHTPEEWLKPDIKDLFPALKAAGHRRALVAPVQFLADHLEVLYDIDVEARKQAEAAGIELARIEAFNTMPLFIQALADVVQRETHVP